MNVVSRVNLTLTWFIVIHLGGDNVTHAGATASDGAGCAIKVVHIPGLRLERDKKFKISSRQLKVVKLEKRLNCYCRMFTH